MVVPDGWLWPGSRPGHRGLQKHSSRQTDGSGSSDPQSSVSLQPKGIPKAQAGEEQSSPLGRLWCAWCVPVTVQGAGTARGTNTAPSPGLAERQGHQMPTEKVITSMTNSQREERDGMRETNGGEHRAEAGGEELTETIDSLSQKGPHQGGNQATGDGKPSAQL